MPASYRLLRRLRSTALAEVFVAEVVDGAQPGSLVALKRPRAECADDPGVRHLFAQELHHGAQMQHPSLVRGVDAGLFRGQPYVAQELIEGPNLEAVWTRLRAARFRLQAGAVAQIGMAIAEALEHLRSITDDGGRLVFARHGGVTLSNLWLAGSSPVVLGDLGLGRDDDLKALAMALLQLLSAEPLPRDPRAIGDCPQEVPPELWRLLVRGLGTDPVWASCQTVVGALSTFAAVPGPVDLAAVMAPHRLPSPPRAPDPTLSAEPLITLQPPDPGSLDSTSDEGIGGGAALSLDGKVSRPSSSPGARAPPAEPVAHPVAPGALPSFSQVGEIELSRLTKGQAAAANPFDEPTGRSWKRPLNTVVALAVFVAAIVLGAPAAQRALATFRASHGSGTLLITVDSDPPGAEIFSGHDDLGTTPLVMPNDYPSDAILTLRLQKHGFQPAEVSFAGGRAAHLRAVLKRAP